MAHEARLRQRHRQNVDGPFYVVNGECMSCGAPEMHSPGLMSHDTTGHCFFTRQPNTAEETNQALVSTWASCCGALRYGGKDRETLIRLAELGLAEQSDFRLKDEPEPLTRSSVSFEFGNADTATTEAIKAQEITKYLAGFLEKPGNGDGRIRSVRFSELGGSFVYEWGPSAQPDVYRATFAVESQPQQGRWAVHITRKDGHSRQGFAISIHVALQQDARFRAIQWFTDDEWNAGSRNGHSLPY
jgi:hypothetical protein